MLVVIGPPHLLCWLYVLCIIMYGRVPMYTHPPFLHSHILPHTIHYCHKPLGPVIDYEELRASCLPIHDRIALWLASDVLVISAIRCVRGLERVSTDARPY